MAISYPRQVVVYVASFALNPFYHYMQLLIVFSVHHILYNSIVCCYIITISSDSILNLVFQFLVKRKKGIFYTCFFSFNNVRAFFKGLSLGREENLVMVVPTKVKEVVEWYLRD